MTVLIRDIQILNQRQNNMEFCFDSYLKLKKDEDKFAKFAEKRVKERQAEVDSKGTSEVGAKSSKRNDG